MKKNWWSFVFIGVLMTIFGVCVFAQTSAETKKQNAVETKLVSIDSKIQDAMVTGEAKTIERFVGDDLIFIHGFFDGGRETKAKLLQEAKGKKRDYVYRKTSSQQAEIHGKFGMVVGRLDIRRLPNAKNNETAEMCYALNYVHLFEFRSGRWQLISHRAAQVLNPPKPCSDQ